MSTRHIPTQAQLDKLAWNIAFYVGYESKYGSNEFTRATLQRKGKAWRHCIDLMAASALNEPLPTFSRAQSEHIEK